jgi:exodeoxyribonuclease VII large subunit
MAEAAPRLNIAELTVSELSAALKRTIEDAYGYVRVRGEISGFRGQHSSGHCYFTLKDSDAAIDAVIWRTTVARLRVKPQEGLEVVVTGRVTTFPGKSKYQIVIDTLEPAGIGALMALMEERKKKLAAEGLFDPARKQLLPYLPQAIGVVTSPTGAVIRDILHRLSDRFPRRVLVWPVRVQGDGAAEEVAAAIRGFNALPEEGATPRPDLLIVARGGGSLEDLWAFNEEIVVRAAAESMIPLISAVGHETDVTLIDFAADKRAPTPTAAAEMAVPVRSELIGQLGDFARRQHACWLRLVENRRKEMRALARALPTRESLFDIPRQRLDGLADRLPQALRSNAHLHERRFRRAAGKLSPETLVVHLRFERSRFATASERARNAIRTCVEKRRERFRTVAFDTRAVRAFDILLDRHDARLDRAYGLLRAFSYQGVLARGFALVRDSEGRPLRTASSVSSGMRMDIEFSDGRVGAVAEGAPRAAPAPSVRRRRRRTGSDEGQGSLFG